MPSIPAQVPLFIALQLRQSGKCRIQPPEWLEKGKAFPLSKPSSARGRSDVARAAAKLQDVLDQERVSSDQAIDLNALHIPFHYAAIAHLLLKQ